MTFSDFVKVMKNFIGHKMGNADYVLYFTNLIMGTPKDDEEERADDAGLYNPLSDKSQDYLRKIFNGVSPLTADNAREIAKHIQKSKFIDKINDLEFELKEQLVENLKVKGFETTVDDVDEVSADIFVKLLNVIADGKQELMPNDVGIRDIKGNLISKIPLASVYYKDGKIHVGGDIIKLPERLIVSEKITDEEQPYINALCEAFSDAIGKKITPETVNTLSRKYKEDFKAQRNYYNNMAWIQRSLRDVYEDTDDQIRILIDDAYEGIREIYYKNYSNGYERMVSVMIKITSTTLNKSTLAHIKNLIGNMEKKGLCHILVNDGIIVSWVDIDA